MDYDQFMTLRPRTVFVRNCTTLQYVTVRYRTVLIPYRTADKSQHYFCEFGMRPLWLYLIFEVTSTVLGTDVPCVIEKRELLMLLHKPLEMRY